MRKFLLSQGVSEDLLNGVDEFIENHELKEEYRYRIPKIKYKYYGKKVIILLDEYDTPTRQIRGLF